MASHLINTSYRIARHAGRQGAHSSVIGQAGVKKYATDTTPKKSQKLFGSVGTLIYLPSTLAPSFHWKKTNLSAAAKEYGIDVICIKEHPTYHEDQGEIRYHSTGHNWILVTSSAATYSIGATVGGVGMLLSPKTFSSFSNIEGSSSHITLAQEPPSFLINVLARMKMNAQTGKDHSTMAYNQD